MLKAVLVATVVFSGNPAATIKDYTTYDNFDQCSFHQTESSGAMTFFGFDKVYERTGQTFDGKKTRHTVHMNDNVTVFHSCYEKEDK